MKVGIVGSRDFKHLEMVKAFVLALPEGSEIVSGGARGVDQMAENTALGRGLERHIFRPDWEREGKRAGFIRNTVIVQASECIVAFWDGQSRGAADTIWKAIHALLPLATIRSDNEEVAFVRFSLELEWLRQAISAAVEYRQQNYTRSEYRNHLSRL